MCQRIVCSKCGRPSYAGCGAHVEQVLRDVPPADRCKCREAKAKTAENAGAPRAGSDEQPSWLQRLFTR